MKEAMCQAKSYSKMRWSAMNAGFFTSVNYGFSPARGFQQEKSPAGEPAELVFSKSETYLEASSTIATEMRQISSSSSVGMTATFTRLSSVEM